MMAQNIAREAKQAIALVKSFSLELAQYSPESQILCWLEVYPAVWIRDAVIEAVYQGRYKVISVQHILSIWQRRGQPVRHFTSGFEQVIAAHLGSPIHLSPSTIAPPAGKKPPQSTKISQTTRLRPLAPGDFAPSPLSSSVLSNLPMDSEILSRNDYPRLAIGAFPVEHMDTLVEVYQTINLPQSAVSRPSVKRHTHQPPVMAEKQKVKHVAYQSEDYRHSANSSPIQPFRPVAHN